MNINFRLALVFIDCLVWGCSTEYEKLWILFAQKSVNVKEISDLIKKVVGMKLSQMHFILNCIPKVWKIFAKWIPHLLTDKYKGNIVTGSYYRNIKLKRPIFFFINDILCKDICMLVYTMIMLHHIDLSFWSNILIRRRLLSCHIRSSTILSKL